MTPKAEATKATTAMTPDTLRNQGVTITSAFLQHLKMEQKASELLYLNIYNSVITLKYV